MDTDSLTNQDSPDHKDPACDLPTQSMGDLNALDGIAIIGMSGRFPGAKNVDEFWKNLIDGVDCISRFSDDELEFSTVTPEAKQAGRKTVAARGILDDVDQFDADFFSIYPKEAEIMDPQHRVFLECAWESLESAGYVPDTYPGMIGVYAGVSLNTYLLYNLNGDTNFTSKLAGNYQVGEYQAMLGNDKDFMPTRVSYKLNLKGPSMAVQTACSSSLVAISQACTSLEAYHCDMALAGGVSITFPQRRDYLFEEEGLASVDGTCRTFDADAKGTVFGHGSAVLLLKRVQDAIQDGDNILAVIRGTAINNDGSDKIGYAAPSVNAQADVIAMAQAAADIDPSTISYIEAHGTGTPLGDPIEIAALTKAFRDGGCVENGFCAIGSGKPNISHLDVASGATGLIKTVMQMRHGQIPRLLNYRSPNPNIDFESSPFFPVAESMKWERNGVPRRAGVSAFGVGGTNAHVVVEEAPNLPPSGETNRPQLIPISARTETALNSARQRLADHLQINPDLNLADVAYTLQVGRKGFDYRSTYVADNTDDLIAALKQPIKPKQITKAGKKSPKVVFMFPGQGAQYVDMGRGLYDHEDEFRNEVDRCAEVLKSHLGHDIRSVLYPSDDAQREQSEKQINETWLTQPAIFVVEYATARLFQHWGIQPDTLIGHSIGEYVCAVLAETFTLEDALTLLAKRAKLMQALPAGSMLGVRLSEQEVAAYLPEGAAIAAANSPKLCTVSGPTEVLETLQADLEKKNIASRMLATSHAFHSSMMDPMLGEFTQFAEQTQRKSPQILWISTYTGSAVTSKDMSDAAYWSNQLRRTVRFSDALQSIASDGSEYIFLEVGPGRALNQFVRQSAANVTPERIVASLVTAAGVNDASPSDSASEKASQADYQAALTAIGKLWASGVPPTWTAFHEHNVDSDESNLGIPTRRRVALPTYPFERKSYWVEPKRQRSTTNACETEFGVACGTQSSNEPISPDTSVTDLTRTNQTTTAQVPSAQAEVTSDVEFVPRDAIATELRTILLNLSGVSVEDDDANFIDLGFDSLFLSQASQAFDSKFGIKITFRQLLGDFSSISAIADFLNEQLPAEKLQALRPALPLQANPAAAHGVDNAGVDALTALERSNLSGSLQNAGDVRRLLDGHLRSIQQLIQVSRSQPSGSSSGLRTVYKPENSNAGSSGSKTSESKRFGPYKPIEKGEQGGLTKKQQDALERLTKRYIRKTKRSKEYTAEHRPHYADPRAVAGFRSQWKELIYPIVSERSKGSKIWDIDGNEYVDITMGFGTYFFGHSPSWLTEALEKQLHTGIEIGPQSPLAGKVAKMLSEFTGLQRVTFCNTGSEAVMAAMRLARTVTGRNRIVYFSGDYHGMFEEVLVRGAWPNGEYSAQPIAPGIPKSLVENILVLEYGDPASLDIIREHGDEIAAVMVEPVQSRNPSHQPREFMHQLREVTRETGSALIFDEVVTGFRCHQGGAQAYFGVEADMATYGKVVGGGIPIGILAGTPKYMDALDGGMWQYGDDSFPEVGVTFFAGTFVRHPLAIAAAHAVLKFLQEQGPELQTKMTERVSNLCRTINTHMEEAQVPIRMSNFSAVAGIEYASDLKYASLLWYYLREKGIHIWEGRPCYFTIAHTDEDLTRFTNAFVESVREMQADGFLPEQSGHIDGTLAIPDNIERFPLAEGQREMWLGAQMSPEAAGPHHACNAFELEGNLNLDALQSALQQVVQRHEGLRATFNLDGTEVLVHTDLDVELRIDDLSDLDEQKQREQIKSVMQSEAERILDLSDGPLVDVRILKLAEKKHQLIFTIQMIVCDGWSHYVLFEELSEIYSAIMENRQPKLKEPIPMRRFAQWQNDYRGSSEAQSSQAYWLKQYETVPAPLDLPTKGLRPLVRTVAADREDTLLSQSFYDEIKQFGRSQRSSAFAVLLAAFQTWLHRLSGTEDIVVGVPFSEQNSLGFDTLVGQAANTLPIRGHVRPEESFSTLLSRTWESLLDAQENSHFTFGQLLQHLDLRQDPSRIPLVSVLFNIDPAMTKVQFAGLKHRFFAAPRVYYQFDLGFNLVEEDEGLRIECDYNKALFDGNVICEWLSGYATMLRAIVSSPTETISQLPLIVDSDRTWLSPKEPIKVPTSPDSSTEIRSRLPVAAKHAQQVNAIRGQLAQLLGETSSSANTKPRVAILGSTTTLGQTALSAVLQHGMTAIPVDVSQVECSPVDRPPVVQSPAIRSLELDHVQTIVEQSKPQLTLVACEGFESLVADSKIVSMQQLTEWNAAPECSPRLDLNSEISETDVALLLYSVSDSGWRSTEVSYSILVETCDHLRSSFADNGGSVLTWTDPNGDQASLSWLLPMALEARAVQWRPMPQATGTFDGESRLAAFSQSADATEVTLLQAPPTVLRQLIKRGWKGSDRLDILITDDCPDDPLIDELQSRCRHAWSLFGPPESLGIAARHHLIADGAAINTSYRSIGVPLSRYRLSVLDERSQPTPAGVEGSICIETTAGEYGVDPNHRASIENPLHGQSLLRTRHRGRRLGDGSIECVPSFSSAIMLRGRDIATNEVERCLRQHQQVCESVVTLREDLDTEPGLVAYLMLKTQADTNDVEKSADTIRELRHLLRKRLPSYMHPVRFVFLDSLPISMGGKIDRASLPKPPVPTEAELVGSEASNTTEECLTTIWKDVLRLEKVGVEDNFFELGGQSLMAVKVFGRIESELGRKLPLATLFQSPTIRQLAEAINSEDSESKGWPSLINIQPDGLRKPLFLVHGAGGNVLLYQALTQYLAPDYPLYGLQSQGLDGKSEPLHSIEDMAERYLTEIREVQPHGPYYLGGYCLGGTVAYEMAQRLNQDGEEVALVAMLDTYNFSRALKSSMIGFLIQKLRFHIGNLIGLRPRDMLDYFKEKYRVARDGEFANLFTSRPGFEVDQDAGRATAGIELEVQGINDTAAEVYIPRPYAGKLTLFKPRINYKFYPDPKMGWGDLALGGLDIVEFPFNPHAMLVEPYVQQLAEALIARMNSPAGSIQMLKDAPNHSSQTDELATR